MIQNFKLERNKEVRFFYSCEFQSNSHPCTTFVLRKDCDDQEELILQGHLLFDNLVETMRCVFPTYALQEISVIRGLILIFNRCHPKPSGEASKFDT